MVEKARDVNTAQSGKDLSAEQMRDRNFDRSDFNLSPETLTRIWLERKMVAISSLLGKSASWKMSNWSPTNDFLSSL